MIQRLRDKRQQDEEGFTLVELLVVIVILGILAAIVVFAVGGITDKGTNTAKATDVSSLQAAEEAQFAAFKPVPAQQAPLYIGMAALESGGFLRTGSTYNAICLSPAQPLATPPVLRGTDYFVIPQVTPAYAEAHACTAVEGAPAGKAGLGYTVAN